MVAEGQGPYLAGLWRKDLEHQLLWRVFTAEPAVEKDQTRGPSWSWASRDGEILASKWPGSSLVGWFCEIADAEVYPNISRDRSSSAEFGQLRGGLLTLTGRLGVFRMPKHGSPSPGFYTGKLDSSMHDVERFWDTAGR